MEADAHRTFYQLVLTDFIQYSDARIGTCEFRGRALIPTLNETTNEREELDILLCPYQLDYLHRYAEYLPSMRLYVISGYWTSRPLEDGDNRTLPQWELDCYVGPEMMGSALLSTAKHPAFGPTIRSDYPQIEKVLQVSRTPMTKETRSPEMPDTKSMEE